MIVYLIRERFDDGMTGAESESYDNIVMSKGGYKTKEEAYAVCKEMAEVRLKTFTEWYNMEFENDFRPEEPGIEYDEEKYEVKTWYVFDDYTYYVDELEVH